jgi:hypothetical protein
LGEVVLKNRICPSSNWSAALARRRTTILSIGMFAIALMTAVSLPTLAQQQSFQFGLVGDTGYTARGVEEFKRMVTDINRTDLAFVVHVGDIMPGANNYNNPAVGAVPCVHERYKDVYETFQNVRHPLIYTPGDNDWTDCHTFAGIEVGPVEALAKVRAMFFPEGRSLGQRTIPVISQAADPKFTKFRENLRWSMGSVTFATLHIVGSNDNFGRTPEMDAESVERKAANIAWLRLAFAQAKTDRSHGLVLLTQANPSFENHWPAGQKTTYLQMIPGTQPPAQPSASAFDDYVKALIEEVEVYEKPVAFLHGDTHRYRIDQPLFSAKSNRRFQNFVRVETFGNPDTHWVRVTIDPANPQLFRFDPQIISENVLPRTR